MWSECVNVSEIKEKTNCSKERMLIEEATSQQIKSGIKKTHLCGRIKDRLPKTIKSVTDFFCVSNSSESFLFFQLQFGLQYRCLKEVSTFLFPLHFS